MDLSPTPSRRPLSNEDLGVLIGLVAEASGELMGGVTDRSASENLARRFVRAGLLTPSADGGLPSPGHVALALEDLVQRLRYALGEYDEPPQPARRAVAHVLRFDSDDAAHRCAATLRADGMEVWARCEQDAPTLYVISPELAPDEGFLRRRRDLREAAARFGGSYKGSQGPPPDAS